MNDLDKLAQSHGFELEYLSEKGEMRRASPEGLRALLAALEALPARGPDLELHGMSGGSEDAACFVPPFLRQNRIWGISCQLYGLRSQRNWGIGDFGDLATLMAIIGRRGGDFVGISPVHALFADDPWRCSPYGPSSKRFLNTLHIAPDLEPEYELIEAINPGVLAELRRVELVDYSGVAAVKELALRQMHAKFTGGVDDARQADFQAFRQRGGEALEHFGLFEALREHFHQLNGYGVAWEDWPADFRGASGAGALGFRRDHSAEIDYRVWLQWLADRQMARAQQAALDAGMRVGLYVDLAVGVVGDSAETWIDPHVAIEGASIGAPPDMLNNRGQNWQLAPLAPEALMARDFAPLRAELGSSMAHAGAVRLDHAMSLTRLYWVPRGMAATEGAYMRYPFGRMIDTVARASRDYRALVIAEALGTVPPGFRDALARADIHAYQVLFFERQHGGAFVSPRYYGVAALACVSTHDLPTLRGWWQGNDVNWRQHIGLYSRDETEIERAARASDKHQLWQALAQDGLTAPDTALPEDLDWVVLADIHRLVARAPSRLFAVQIEDALGVLEQANLPGETAPHPNWRRKLPVDIEALAEHPGFITMVQAMVEERPRR